MGKIKEFFSNQRLDLEKLFRNYMMALVSGMLLSVFYCIYECFDYDDKPIALEYILVFLLLFGLGSILIETLFVNAEGIRNNRAIFYGSLVNAVVSLIWTIVNVKIEQVSELVSSFGNEDIAEMIIWKILSVYLIVLVAVSLYKIIKKNNIEFQLYAARVIFGLLKVWAVYFVLIFSINMLLELFSSLIYEIDTWDISEYLIILFSGFLLYPYTLMTITDAKDENSRFTRGFVNFLWLPIIYVAIAIMYMYVVRIIVEGELPSNEVFSYCATIFTFGMPAWFIAYGLLKEGDLKKGQESKYTKVVKNVKYTYIPLLILEIICIGIRISDYGLTESRYMAVVLIIAQAIYLAWDLIGKLLKRQVGYENYILVAMGILIIVLICPVLNMEKLCFISQRDRFEKAMEEGDYYTAESSYSEIKYTEYGEKYLFDTYTTNEKYDLEQLLMEYADYNYNYYEYVSFSVDYDTEESIKIQGYTNMYSFEYDGEQLTSKDISDITISFGNNQEVCVDMTETVEYFIKQEENKTTSYPSMDYYYIDLGPNCCIVLDRIRFGYSFGGSEYKYLDLEGYVLTNEGAHNGQ